MNNERLQKATSRGQITLPIAWRELVGTNNFVVRTLNDRVEISPARLQRGNKEITVFDAIRDNKGKGIRAKDLRKILIKLNSAR